MFAVLFAVRSWLVWSSEKPFPSLSGSGHGDENQVKTARFTL